MIKDAQGHRLPGTTPVAVSTYNDAGRAFNLVHGDAVGLYETAREAAPISRWRISGQPRRWRSPTTWPDDASPDFSRRCPSPGDERTSSGPILTPCRKWSKALALPPSRCSTAI